MMKRIFLSVLIGVSVVGAIFPLFSGSEAARTSEDYPLVCRGGGSLVTGIASGERNIGFTFVRGTKPAGEGLAPGECSWVDRGMYPNEPDRVSQHVEEGSDSLKVGGTLAPENKWYEELHSADKYWTFMVSNNGRGQLIATSARPNPGMDVSPTAKVPPGSMTPQPTASPGPGMNARVPDDETPKMIALRGPSGPSSRTRLLEGLNVGLKMNIPPAPRALSREEKMGLLKSAGLETLDETATPYVTLTPQQPHVAGRGTLIFLAPLEVDSGIYDNIAEFRPAADGAGWLTVRLNFDTKAIYLVTFTVHSSSYDRFVIKESEGHFTDQIFPDKKPKDWQHLNMIVEVADPGNYYFKLTHEAPSGNHWHFGSCDVTIWKK